mmetsp:Transcript_34341/g.45212  ORF Transcript_34341/g.45212 Transcript_34341/m.45212 type:complete len:87 (+) Transcript_34341:1141-1401(+)
MAPEIEASEPHDHIADIWSLGQLAYQMLSRPEANALHFLEEGSEARWLSGVPTDVKKLVEQMVSPHPALRPTCKAILSHPWLQRSC